LQWGFRMKEDCIIKERLKLLQKYIYYELLLLRTKVHDASDTERNKVHLPKSYKRIKHQKSNRKCRNFKRTLHPAGLYAKNAKRT